MLIKLSILYLLLRQLQAYDLVTSDPFWLLAQSPTFIDKTSFLPELFNPARGNIIITTPPGFGKTSALYTIEKFAGIELNDDFSIKKFKQTDSFKIFQNTTIFQDDDFIRSHLSQYIVISLDLQIDLASNFTADTIYDRVSDLLFANIKNYTEFLKNVTKTHEEPIDPEIKLIRRRNDAREEREFIRDFLSRNATRYDGNLMLRRIIKSLSTHFNRKVILLVDNYDHVAKGFLFKDANPNIQSFYEIINAMIYHAYDLHFCSNYLFKIFIASSTAVPLEWVEKMQHKFYILNFSLYRFLSPHPLLELLAFTPSEVDHQMSKFKLKPDEKEVLLTYYNPHLSYPEAKRIYCPRAVMIFIDVYRKSVQTHDVLDMVYAEAIERIGFLKEHLNNGSRLELELLTIIANHSIEIKIHNLLHRGNLLNKSLQRIKEMMTSPSLAISKQTWSYLFETGFLINVDGNSSTSYKVSNHEYQRILYKLFIDHHDESKLPLNELGKCSQQFVQHSVVYSKESSVSLFKLVENLLAKCINNTASYLLGKDNEIKYQAILYAASLQFALNSTKGNFVADFVVSTMQFRGKSGDTYYGVYFYNRNEKVCAIVILKNSSNDGKDREVLLNEVATTYSLPHADVKHMFYAVVNVFEDGHMETFSTTYERYGGPK